MMSANAACVSRPNGAVAARTNTRFAASGFYGNASALARVGSGSRAGERGALVINMAASKEKKARDIGMLKGMLEKEETLLVAGFNFQGLRVRTPASSGISGATTFRPRSRARPTERPPPIGRRRVRSRLPSMRARVDLNEVPRSRAHLARCVADRTASRPRVTGARAPQNLGFRGLGISPRRSWSCFHLPRSHSTSR